MITRKIKSIERKHYKGYVHNLAVEGDETYFANNILVHNCRSTLVPIFVGESEQAGNYYRNYEDKKEKIDRSIRPAEGFGA